jgi:hypothetical protein
MADYSREKTIKAIEKWFKAMKGDEEFLQGLFYDENSIEIHKKILEDIKFSDGEEFYFSRIPRGSLSKSKDKRYNLWCKKGKEEGEESTWTSDGYIICSSNEAKNKAEEDKGLVEFKGTYNINLRHNDIAKLIQYLYFCGCKGKYLLWFGPESMIEDIIWICGYFTKGKIDDAHFLEVCNNFKTNDYKKFGVPRLSDLYKDIKKDIKNGSKVRQLEPKNHGSYNTKQFEKIVQEEYKEKIKIAIRKYLILINYDECSVKPAKDNGQVPKTINLQELCDGKDQEFNFLEYIKEAKKCRNL